jgi:hypothetical protein
MFAPDGERIYLFAPPFNTVATRMAPGDKFWSRFGALDQIAPELSVFLLCEPG